jgi:hypothetical protein|tara:strand:- start:38 stop:1867 length:1830 start_codon:yes stop_codon:yes gene_type:complete
MELLNHLSEVRGLQFKIVSSRSAKRSGTETFDELSNRLEEGEISNDSNREVELKIDDKYAGKAAHLMRFVSGISEKSAMLITVLRDGLDDVGYIRDDGTLSGLAFRNGEYYDTATLTPNEFSIIISDIDDEYEISSIDREFIDMIENVFVKLSEEEKKLPISWKSIVEDNDEIKDFYFSTTLDYVINLLTMNQHSKDMRNANLQPNPWIAFQYYWVPNQLLPEYKKTLLGKKLFEFVSDKPGLAFATTGKIMGKLQSRKDKEMKAVQLKPLVLAYCGVKFCENIDEMIEFWEMVARFAYHENSKVYSYWTNMFKQFIKETSYSDVVTFYEEQYKKAYAHPTWNGPGGPNAALKRMLIEAGKTTCGPISSFSITRDQDNGICFLTYAIWCKRMYERGWDATVQLIVNSYVSRLEGSLNLKSRPSDLWNDGVYPVWKALSMGYVANDLNNQCKHIFKPMMEDVATAVKERKQDRYHANVLRKKSLRLHYDVLKNQGLNTLIKLFPLASNGDISGITNINFGGDGDGLHWLHPNSPENKAKDGFLGLVGDNLVEPWKSMDWSPYIKENSNYWKLLLNHNEDKFKLLTDKSLKIHIWGAIMVLDFLSTQSLNV